MNKTKTTNLTGTIRMILADKNSSFYQSSVDESQPIDKGKFIREAFFKANSAVGRFARTLAAFAAASTCVVDEIKKIDNYSNSILKPKNAAFIGDDVELTIDGKKWPMNNARERGHNG